MHIYFFRKLIFIYIYKMGEEINGDFEKFNKKNYSYSSINKYFKKGKTFYIEEIEEFIKDTIAYVVNGGRGFYVTKEIYDNDSDNLDLTLSKKLEILQEKIKIYNDDENDKARKYKYVTFKSILMGILYDISYKRYKFKPTTPFEELYKNKIRDWVPDDIPDNLNIYTGSPIKYNKELKINIELINPFLYHIKEILADGIEDSYNFILKMLAHMVQKPNVKTQVCMVFISSCEGAGKNIFFDNYANKIIGKKYSAHINDLDTLMGSFNSILSNKIITILDEVKTKFGGRSTDRFKSMISSKILNLNQKGIDTITMDDYNNYIILSNNDVPVNISESDRRFFVSNVSNKHVGNHEYFNNLTKLWENNEAVEHFYHYLCNIDISNFKPQANIPVTPRKIEIKQETLTSPIKFLIEIAKNKFEDITTKNSQELYEIYQEYCYENLDIKPYRKIDFFKKINKFIDKPEINSERRKIYTLSKKTIEAQLFKYFKVDNMNCFEDIEYTISSDEEPNNADKLTSSESSSSSSDEGFNMSYTSDTSDTSDTSEKIKNNENILENNLNFELNEIIPVNKKKNIYKCKINGKWKFGTYKELDWLQSKSVKDILGM